MKTYAFVRSRTFYREFDYRLLTPITEIPQNIEEYFSGCVSQFLSDGTEKEDEWDKPAWLLIKKENCLLWGLSIYNRIFSRECDKEESGRTGLRCFCGVVIADYDKANITLPYEISAFQHIFDKTVKFMWKGHDYEIPNVKVELGYSDNNISSSLFSESLNNDENICRLFPNTQDATVLLSACLASKADTSIAVNVIELKQVLGEHVSIRNVILRNHNEKNDIIVDPTKCSRLQDQMETVIETGDNGPDPMSCNKCRRQVTWLDQNGICEDCIRKMKRRRIIVCIFIGALILMGLFVYMREQSKDSVTNKKVNPKEHIQKESPSIKHSDMPEKVYPLKNTKNIENEGGQNEDVQELEHDEIESLPQQNH